MAAKVNQISEFRGDYYFLSNFFSAPVSVFGRTFLNNEAAFQAAKCPVRMDEFVLLNPSEAKKLGRRVQLRSDWENVKSQVMYDICKAKFSQNDELRKMLLSTGDAELIEGNHWGDRVWGVCDGVGENRLGQILMRIRTEFSAGATIEMTPEEAIDILSHLSRSNILIIGKRQHAASDACELAIRALRAQINREENSHV